MELAGATRLAVRTDGTLSYLLSDHLGSTSLTTDSSGARISELRYPPFGEIRYSWTANLSTTPPYTPTRYTFTGQYSYMDDPAPSASQGFGLMFYVSRWYDPSLGRFVQADALIPESTQGTQAWDRYAYVNNNLVRYNDPTGHMIDKGDGGCSNPDPDCDMPKSETSTTATGKTSKTGDGDITETSQISNLPQCETAIQFEDCKIAEIEFSENELHAIVNILYWGRVGEVAVGGIGGTATLPEGFLIWAYTGWEYNDLDAVYDVFSDAYDRAVLSPDHKTVVTIWNSEKYGFFTDFIHVDGNPSDPGITAPVARLINLIISAYGALTD